MKPSCHAALVAALAIGAIAGPALAADDDTTLVLDPGNLPPHVTHRLEESARAGTPALIRYLNRTRFMYQLRVEDVVKEVKRPARADASPPQASEARTAAVEASSTR